MNRFLDIDVLFKKVIPIFGYRSQKLVSIEEALEPIESQIDQLSHYIKKAKTHCHFPSEHDLTQDESAAVYIYTMEWDETTSLNHVLNQTLRGEDWQAIKLWLPYLKLFDTALDKLPTVKETVWRGVPCDIEKKLTENQIITWWSINSCSSSVDVIKKFLGNNKNSTLFLIEVINGKKISGYTENENEDEIILKMGTDFRVKSHALDQSHDLHIVHLIEIGDDGKNVISAMNGMHITEKPSNDLTTYQTNMERTIQWIHKIEQQLDQEQTIATNDLQLLKEQFQRHEDFMITLTNDQNQIGQVLEEGNRLLISSDIDLQSREENEIKEQMKILNHRWESLRSKSLDRQSFFHKTLMKLQIDQLESFDQWLTYVEQRISTELEIMEENLPGINRQLKQLVQLQDEIIDKQQMTESLQNMIIISSSIESKYSTKEIQSKLLDMSKRWANICEFVRSCWIQIQEIKIQLEKSKLNQESPIYDNDNNNQLQHDFDLSARKFLDWMDSIEIILDDKQSKNLDLTDRQDIIQEIKTKYISYDKQFKELIQTGNNIIEQLKKETNEDSIEHKLLLLQTLEKRWQALHEQIITYEENKQ